MKNPKNITNKFFYYLFLSSRPNKTWGNTTTLKYRQREGKQPVKTFSVSRQGKHKARRGLTKTFLLVTKQSYSITLDPQSSQGTFDMSKRPKKIRYTSVQVIRNHAARAEIPKDIGWDIWSSSRKSGRKFRWKLQSLSRKTLDIKIKKGNPQEWKELIKKSRKAKLFETHPVNINKPKLGR